MRHVGLWFLLAVLASVFGCQDRRESTQELIRGGGPVGVDLGFLDVEMVEDPVPPICAAGSRRCVAESSPVFEICLPDGQGFELGLCEPGEVCRQRRCVPFSCVPGRPICLGTSTRALCDSTGVSFEAQEECDRGRACLGGTCVDRCALAENSNSYLGCRYVSQRLPNLYQRNSEDQSPFAVVVANPDRLFGAEVSIRSGSSGSTDPVALIQEMTLKPSSLYQNAREQTLRSELLLSNGGRQPIGPRADSVLLPGWSAGVFLLPKGGASDVYEISSTGPIVAYQFSPYCCNFTATNDASLLLPVNTLQTRYRVLGYPVMRFSAEETVRPYVTIVATEDDTNVEVLAPSTWGRIDLAQAVGQTKWVLSAGEMALVEPIGVDPVLVDLSGMEVRADKPVAVFSGHPCTFVPQDQWACDHLEEQLLPADVLGNTYLLVPTRRRSQSAGGGDSVRREATYWRLVADEESEVEFSADLDEIGSLSPSNPYTADCRELRVSGRLRLKEGEVCEFGTSQPVGLRSSGRLIVGGVVSGHESTGVLYYGSQAGDPSFFLLPPQKQFRSEYSLALPPTFSKTYVSVALPKSASVSLDGVNITQGQRLERQWLSLDGAEWEVFQLAVSPGLHRLESDARFGLVAYAYDDYVSYAFPGGLDLLPKGVDP